MTGFVVQFLFFFVFQIAPKLLWFSDVELLSLTCLFVDSNPCTELFEEMVNTGTAVGPTEDWRTALVSFLIFVFLFGLRIIFWLVVYWVVKIFTYRNDDTQLNAAQCDRISQTKTD